MRGSQKLVLKTSVSPGRKAEA